MAVRLRSVLLGSLLAGVVAVAVARPKAPEPPPEELEVAAVLIRDAHWDRAAVVLAGLTLEPGAPGYGRWLVLQGLVDAQAGRHPDAITKFEAAIEVAQAEGAVEADLYVHLARSRLATGDPAAALAALEAPGTDALAATWWIRGTAQQRQGDDLAAWAAWDEGQRRFPDDAALRRARVTALVGFGLSRVAVEEARPLLDREATAPADWLTLTEAMRRAGDPRPALTLLEEAHLRFPDDLLVLRALAVAHLQAGNPRAAARLLAPATRLDPALCAPAAEAFRQAGDLVQAGRMNTCVPDPVERTRQRLGLLLEQGEWARATALGERALRLGLDRDDQVRYGLAFAHARLGAFPEAERWLDGIAAADVFEDATKLRESMQTCRDGGACP